MSSPPAGCTYFKRLLRRIRTTWVPPSAKKCGRAHVHTNFVSHLDFPFFSFLRLGLGADLQPRRLDVAEVCRGDEVGAERAADGDRHVAKNHLNDAGFFAQPAVFQWEAGTKTGKRENVYFTQAPHSPTQATTTTFTLYSSNIFFLLINLTKASPSDKSPG